MSNFTITIQAPDTFPTVNEDATKIAEEVAKELGLSTPERGSNNRTHWVSATRWTPSIELTVFYNKQEES